MSAHGTDSRYVNERCRCRKCRDAHTKAHRQLRGRTPRRHGLSGYINYRCRCDICSAAAARKNRTRYYDLKGTEPSRHGTRYAYSVHGCRCDDCVHAQRSYERARRERVA